MTNATVYEQGNGFPTAGDYCSDGDYLYRINAITSRIQTGRLTGNYVFAAVERVAWDACSEDEQHTARLEVTEVPE